LGRWFLVNASPDLPRQIEEFPELQPARTPLRNSPIAGVLLTNADLDHALGLFSLREGGRFNIYATSAVRTILTRSIGLGRILDTFCGADWQEPPQQFAPLLAGGEAAKEGLNYRMIALPGKAPPFAGGMANRGIHSVAYQFLDRRTGGRLLVAPDVSTVNDELLKALENSDTVIFDGTFWSGDELKQVKAKARTAGQMGHVTIKDSSLDLLSKLPARRKIYIHINNTNPVLAKRSRERTAVERAGITIGYDGLEFKL
jgi:pyrroloquinoline quinone biosynthesis protein B